MIIKKTEVFIYLDTALPEKLLLPSFSKKIMTKAAKKNNTKKSIIRKAAGKKKELRVKNSLGNNINARKEKGISRPKKRTPVSMTHCSKKNCNQLIVNIQCAG